MTKHFYHGRRATGAVIRARFNGPDLAKALAGYRIPLTDDMRAGGRFIFGGDIPYGGQVFSLSVSYEGSHTAPEDVVASTMVLGRGDEKTLKMFLDDLVTATGMEEIPSPIEYFDGMFTGWDMAFG